MLLDNVHTHRINIFNFVKKNFSIVKMKFLNVRPSFRVFIFFKVNLNNVLPGNIYHTISSLLKTIYVVTMNVVTMHRIKKNYMFSHSTKQICVSSIGKKPFSNCQRLCPILPSLFTYNLR